MLSALIDDLTSGERRTNPSAERLTNAFEALLAPDVDPALVGGLLVALRTQEPSGETLALLAEVIRSRAVTVPCTASARIDTCGTGGDRSSSFNVSTAAAFVVAAAGGIVAKHGNRSVSSACGSADLIEALGLPLDLEPATIARQIDVTGFGFLYAPRFHPVLARVQSARRALGVPTLFNLVGPLVNPARPRFQVVGVARADLARTMGEALARQGTERSLVVHCDGLDELGLHAPSRGHLVRDGRLEDFVCDPRDFGLERRSLESVRGGGASENAARFRALLQGEPGALADVVALNAAAACFVGGLVPSLDAGFEHSRDLLAGGAAQRVFERVSEAATTACEVAP